MSGFFHTLLSVQVSNLPHYTGDMNCFVECVSVVKFVNLCNENKIINIGTHTLADRRTLRFKLANFVRFYLNIY